MHDRDLKAEVGNDPEQDSNADITSSTKGKNLVGKGETKVFSSIPWRHW